MDKLIQDSSEDDVVISTDNISNKIKSLTTNTNRKNNNRNGKSNKNKISFNDIMNSEDEKEDKTETIKKRKKQKEIDNVRSLNKYFYKCFSYGVGASYNNFNPFVTDKIHYQRFNGVVLEHKKDLDNSFTQILPDFLKYKFSERNINPYFNLLMTMDDIMSDNRCYESYGLTDEQINEKNESVMNETKKKIFNMLNSNIKEEKEIDEKPNNLSSLFDNDDN